MYVIVPFVVHVAGVDPVGTSLWPVAGAFGLSATVSIPQKEHLYVIVPFAVQVADVYATGTKLCPVAGMGSL